MVEIKDFFKHFSAWLCWMIVVFIFGIFIGGIIFNRYAEFRVEDAIRQGSIVYKQYIVEKDTFDPKKKEVYKIYKSNPMIVESPTSK